MPLPFSKRLTTSTGVFCCIFISAPQGAQQFPMPAALLGALALEYAQLVSVYRLLLNQDTSNDDAELTAAINMAVTTVSALKTTLSAIPTPSGDAGIQLGDMRVVVANVLTQLLSAQNDMEVGDDE